MELRFMRAFAKFTIAITIAIAVILIVLGVAILVFPQLFLTILTYTVGAVCLILGVVIIGRLLSGIFGNRGGVK